MKTALETLVEKYGKRVNPDSNYIKALVKCSTEYALKVVKEIEENIGYYTDNDSSMVNPHAERFDQLRKTIQNG